MSDQPDQHDEVSASRWGHWALFACVGLIVIVALYVLSIGPAVYLFEVSGEPEWLGDMFSVIYRPIEWLLFGTESRELLESYIQWWADLASP